MRSIAQAYYPEEWVLAMPLVVSCCISNNLALSCCVASHKQQQTSLHYEYGDSSFIIHHSTFTLTSSNSSQWHPNPHWEPSRLLTLLQPPRHLLSSLQRHLLLMVRRRSTEGLTRRLTLLTSTKVCWLLLIYGLLCLFDCLAVLKWVRLDIGILDNAMAILDSFLNNIFKRIATEALSKSSSLIEPCYLLMFF